MFCDEPTARNSNLLPVNANGLVRLRSPASRGSFGSTRGADVERAALLGGLGGSLFDLLEDVLQLIAEEDRDDRRRRLVGAEPVIVAGAARCWRGADPATCRRRG